MTSWVDRQLLEAFRVYQRYLGISLHFRDGTSYDYTLYNGATRTSIEAFKQKPKTERALFMQLRAKIESKGINAEEFLFANARHDNLDIRKLLTQDAFNTFYEWQSRYGTRELFCMNALGRLQRLGGNEYDEEPEDLAIRLLDGSDANLEIIAYLLQNNPEIGTPVRVAAEQNVLKKMQLDKVIKCQKFYSYFCTI